MAAPKVSLEKVVASVTLPLSPGGKLKVEKNHKVQEGQVIVQRKASSQIKNYHLSRLIGVPPKKAIKFLVKKLGEEVEEGELVAQKKSLLGKEEKFFAPIKGILDSLTEDGVLRIKKEIPEEEIKAPFSGRVTKISPNSVSLSFAAVEIKGGEGRGGKASGYLAIIGGEEQDLFSLDNSCQKQIIALQGKLPKGFWYKAASLGAAGFVVGGLIEESLLKEIEEEENSLPVVILGENGKINQEIWEELRKNQGKMILLEGKEKRILIPQ